MKEHPWWGDKFHDFKGKAIKYLDYLEERENNRIWKEREIKLLEQIENNVYINNNVEEPLFKSRILIQTIITKRRKPLSIDQKISEQSNC
jgi:hypothetical protein